MFTEHKKERVIKCRKKCKLKNTHFSCFVTNFTCSCESEVSIFYVLDEEFKLIVQKNHIRSGKHISLSKTKKSQRFTNFPCFADQQLKRKNEKVKTKFVGLLVRYLNQRYEFTIR